MIVLGIQIKWLKMRPIQLFLLCIYQVALLYVIF